MDKSEQYVKMCKQAEEIQKDTYIWLPRQDQLQETVGFYTDNLWFDTLLRFNNFVHDTMTNRLNNHIWEVKYPQPFNSLEQLWLAFVMREKYNKIWNGEEWVKGGIE